MLKQISITIPSCRPDWLIRCIESLDLYSRYTHELVIVLDKHGSFKDKWKDFKLSHNYKHDLKILTTDRFEKAPANSTFKKKGDHTRGKCLEACNIIQNWAVTQSKYDWVLTPTDDDFFYLPDWDYHLLKHVDEKKKEIIYHSKQLCPREVKDAKIKTNWIGFEHPKGSTDGKLRERTPLKVSYALEETKNYRIDRAFLTRMKNFDYGHNVPLLIHKETMLKAGRKPTLLESCDKLWDGLDPAWTSLNAFEAFGCRKCSVQNSNVIHYPKTIIDDLQNPPVIWKAKS